MQSIILLTTQTSGTLSYERILTTLANMRQWQSHIRIAAIADKLSKEEFKNYTPPFEDHTVLVNTPYNLGAIDFKRYKIIANFRDPRDRICNAYHWSLVHDSKETPEQREARINANRDIGIEAWIQDHYDKNLFSNTYYDQIFNVIETLPPKNVLIATYARLCLDFDSLIEKISAHLGTELTEAQKNILAPERPENLPGNAQWIGAKWAGSDINPGRYKAELDPALRLRLSQYYAPTLRKMAKLDPDFAETYLQDL